MSISVVTCLAWLLAIHWVNALAARKRDSPYSHPRSQAGAEDAAVTERQVNS